MGIDLWFRTNFSAPRPTILKVKVLKWPHIWGMCFNAKQSGFPVQPDEKIWKNWVFRSTYRESSYHIFHNRVVRHIPLLFFPQCWRRKEKIKDWMSWTNNHRDPQIYNRAPSEKLSTKYWFTQPKNSGPTQLIWTLNATLRAQCKAMRCVLTASYKN